MPLDVTGLGCVVLASEGRRFSDAAVIAAAASGQPVMVVAIVRIWGTSFGLPNPWLMPSKREWAAQREVVADAIARLEAAGIAARGSVIATRHPARRIVAEAERAGAARIVMGADPTRGWFAASLMWSQEPQRVARRARARGIDAALVIGEPVSA